MTFSPERVEQAYHYWRCLPFYQRTERELQLALKRHDLVEIDARNYARDLIAAATDLEPSSDSLRPHYSIIDTPEGFHQKSQKRWRELAMKYGCPGHVPTITFIEKELEELKRLRASQRSEGSVDAKATADTGSTSK